MDENVYLDNAATSWPKPEPVYALMDRFSRDIGVNPGRGGHAMAADADRMVRQTRRLLGAAFGHRGSIDRVVFAQNGTDALNTALNGLIADGDHVISTGLDHNAVSRCLNHAMRDRGVRVSSVAPDEAGYIDPEAIERAYLADTRLLVVNHASNVIGTVQPLAELAALARRRGVRILVDAAQTAGVVPIDVDALGIDVLAFPGHKGLFGAMGSGGLVVADDVSLIPSRFGGTGFDSASRFQPDAYPFRLEPGTLSAPAIGSLFAAQLWFGALGRQLLVRTPEPGDVLDVPLDIDDALDAAEAISSAAHGDAVARAFAHVHKIELARLSVIETLLLRSPRIRILGAARGDARVATISFTVDGMAASEVAERLDADHHVCCRAGLQCAPAAHAAFGTLDGGGVRLSPGYFTTEADMERLAAGLADVVGTGESVTRVSSDCVPSRNTGPQVPVPADT